MILAPEPLHPPRTSSSLRSRCAGSYSTSIGSTTALPSSAQLLQLVLSSSSFSSAQWAVLNKSPLQLQYRSEYYNSARPTDACTSTPASRCATQPRLTTQPPQGRQYHHPARRAPRRSALARPHGPPSSQFSLIQLYAATPTYELPPTAYVRTTAHCGLRNTLCPCGWLCTRPACSSLPCALVATSIFVVVGAPACLLGGSYYYTWWQLLVLLVVVVTSTPGGSYQYSWWQCQ